MISAVLYCQGNNLVGCRIEGHSGWADAGGDIVCAAVSILSCTCVNALETVCGVIPLITEHNEEKGILAFELPEMTEEENGRAQILMKALEQGLNDLTADQPDYVSLSIKERRKLP